jgi:hypothetical protein
MNIFRPPRGELDCNADPFDLAQEVLEDELESGVLTPTEDLMDLSRCCDCSRPDVFIFLLRPWAHAPFSIHSSDRAMLQALEMVRLADETFGPIPTQQGKTA